VSELLALIEGQLAARIRADKSGRLSLEYENAWRDSAHGYPLSVNMPLAQIVYPHRTVWAYLWNLLPENPSVLQRWAQQYHVAANNPYKLLTYVGADVPGAAQFIPPERSAEFHTAQHTGPDAREKISRRWRPQYRTDRDADPPCQFQSRYRCSAVPESQCIQLAHWRNRRFTQRTTLFSSAPMTRRAWRLCMTSPANFPTLS
jgi:HipA-like protein